MLETTQSIFFTKAAQWAHKPRFMIQENGQWKPILWSEYREQVELVAYALNSLGIKPGNKVGIFSQNSLEWIYAGLGITTAQAVLVPIYHNSTPDMAGYIVNHGDLQLLFVQNLIIFDSLISAGSKFPLLKYVVLIEGDSKENRNGLKFFNLDDLYHLGENHRDSHPHLIEKLVETTTEEMVAQMLYTSGTTGRPKGVPLTYGNLIASTNDWLAINGPLVSPDSVDLHWLPNAHIFGWGSLGLGNILGFTSYLTNPLEVLKLMPEIKPHLFMSVPAYFEKLYQLSVTSSESKNKQIETLQQLMGGRITFLLSGGAGLKREVKEFFLKAKMWITEGYGLTECSPTLTMNRHDDFNFDSVGKPYPCVNLKLAEDGEILARGPVIFQGYYKDPVATSEVFTEDGWFKTGDVGQWMNDGFLKIMGRKKDIIVTSGGKNIPPENIELRFKDDPYIEHLVVYGDGKKYLVAVVTLGCHVIESWAKENGIPFESWEELCTMSAVETMVQDSINRVNSELSSFETIKYYRIVPENFTPLNGLLTSSLKVKRKKVYQRYETILEELYRERPVLLQEKG
ncbi:MAG: AMP-dependent synthetase/ligase [Candidatus Marinimicrobia bacterium]|jgi:long-chain acyl-CoA synthetase|nr:AMP-dependent synthetase/ligase [Candidatus Neomarinimicrobiota bacterium]